MAILADKFVSLIAHMETELGRDVGPDDVDKLGEGNLLSILQLFLGLEIVSSVIKKNTSNKNIYPIWGKLIDIYKVIPQRVINNFGGNTNFVTIEESNYRAKVKELVALN